MKVFFGLCLVALLLFAKTIFQGAVPFPGDYLMAWYEPWRGETVSGEALGLPHKPVADDVFRHQYPMKVLAWQLIRGGEWPLWNPYNGAGQPLWAMMHPGFLNPINFLFLIMPASSAWTWVVALQLIFLGLATYVYARRVGLSEAAAGFSALVFILSGFVVVRLVYTEFLYVLVGLPILLYLIEELRQKRRSLWVALTPLVVAYLIFSGQPQMIFYVLAVTVAYAIYRQCLAAFLPHLLLGIGLGAVQLLPTIELYLQAALSPASSRFIFARFLLPPAHLITLLIPNYFGNQATYNFWGFGDYIETAAYLGSVPWLLAILAVIKRSRITSDISRFWLWVVIITVISTLDWPLSRLLFSLPIPVVATGVPARVLGITAFAVSILAGLGFDIWRRSQLARATFRRTLLIFGIVLGLIASITLLARLFGAACPREVPQCRLVAWRNTLLEIGMFLVAAAILWRKPLKNRKYALAMGFGLTSLVVAVGLYNAQKFLPFTLPERVMPQSALLSSLTKLGPDSRVWGIGRAHLKTDLATYYRFLDPEYFEPLYIRRYGELIAYANAGELPEILPRSDIEITNDATVSAQLAFRRERLFDLLSVGYLIAAKGETSPNSHQKIVWQNAYWQVQRRAAVPRAYVVNQHEVVTEKTAILTKLFDPSFNPQESVVLEKKVSLPSLVSLANNASSSRIIRSDENTVEIEVVASQPAIMVLTDNYYSGWRAFVDGNETEIFRANYAFRGIAVPLGKHNIVFRYDPLSIRIGLKVSIFVFGFWLVTFIYTVIRQWYNIHRFWLAKK